MSLETAKAVLHDNELKLRQVARDFRSDTMTIPTSDMFIAMAAGSRGDDTYGEDETTTAFEARIAALTGKEAGLFCVSGTLTNQLALRIHLVHPPQSVVCDSRAHIHRYEAGGIAYHSQAQTLTVDSSNGRYLTLEDIAPILETSDNIHWCPTRVVELENTLSGTLFPPDEARRISDHVHKLGIAMHMDGARIWETSASTGISLKELCDPFDSVSLCLSKGIGAPIGSILVGSKSFIAQARRYRKLFGGQLRQSGLLVAAAEFAMDKHFPLMKKSHDLARRLAIGLQESGVKLLLPCQTNMVFFDCAPLGLSIEELAKRARALPDPIIFNGSRLVLHHQTSSTAVDDLLKLVKDVQQEFVTQAKPLSEQEAKESLGFAHGENFPLTSQDTPYPGR